MTFGPSSMLPESENANYMLKTSGPDLPNLPTFPSLPTSSDFTFYLAPSIIEAMQRLTPAMLVSPPTFCSFSDSPNPGQTTLDSDYNTAEWSPNNQTLNLSANNAFTSGIPYQESPKVANYADPFLEAQAGSSGANDQATVGQQKEKEAKMLEYYEIQLEQKDLELAAAEKSNTQLRATLSLMEDELAGAQAKLDQKNIYISACDKKIDALQKKIALLTRPHTGPTVGHIRTETKMDAKAEPQFHMSMSKPKKIYIPHTQPSGESRLNGMNYADPSEGNKASFNRPCEQSLRRQAELEDRYIVRDSGQGAESAEEWPKDIFGETMSRPKRLKSSGRRTRSSGKGWNKLILSTPPNQVLFPSVQRCLEEPLIQSCSRKSQRQSLLAQKLTTSSIQTAKDMET